MSSQPSGDIRSISKNTEQPTSCGPCHIGIFDSQDKGRIRLGKVNLSLFRHQPIVQCRTGSTHMQGSRRRWSKTHSRRFFRWILPLQRKDLRQFRHDGQTLHGADATGLENGTVPYITVLVAFALQLFDQRNAGYSRHGPARTAQALGEHCGVCFANFRGQIPSSGRDKGLIV